VGSRDGGGLLPCPHCWISRFPWRFFGFIPPSTTPDAQGEISSVFSSPHDAEEVAVLISRPQTMCLQKLLKAPLKSFMVRFGMSIQSRSRVPEYHFCAGFLTGLSRSNPSLTLGKRLMSGLASQNSSAMTSSASTPLSGGVGYITFQPKQFQV
jgi:hypothetical protein